MLCLQLFRDVVRLIYNRSSPNTHGNCNCLTDLFLGCTMFECLLKMPLQTPLTLETQRGGKIFLIRGSTML